jgi:hypothetical protein
VRPKARVAVWWDDARTRRLPLVCVFSGEPAAGFKQFAELSIPALVWFLVLLLPIWLLGGLPGLGRLSIQLPVSAAWSRRLRRTSGPALALIPVTGLLLLAALNDWFSLRVVFWVLAAAGFAASMALTLRRESWQPRYSISLKSKSGHKYIVLSGVHPLFAAAVEAQYRKER